MNALRILITSGATREAIDGVRFITNVSTGATGAHLAERWTAVGHHVTVLAGEGAMLPALPGSAPVAAKGPPGSCEVTRFRDFASLESLLRARLAEEPRDLVVHLAAVSDYSVEWIDAGEGRTSPDPRRKLLSDASTMLIGLRRNPKLVDRLRSYSAGSAPVLVAFKLTQGADGQERERQVRSLFSRSRVDLVVHNDLNRRGATDREFRIFRAPGAVAGMARTVHELADRLLEEVRALREEATR